MQKSKSRQTEMFALIEELYQSKMTRAEYCEQKGLSRNCFYYWQKKYRQHHQESHAGFISVRNFGYWSRRIRPKGYDIRKSHRRIEGLNGYCLEILMTVLCWQLWKLPSQ